MGMCLRVWKDPALSPEQAEDKVRNGILDAVIVRPFPLLKTIVTIACALEKDVSCCVHPMRAIGQENLTKSFPLPLFSFTRFAF